jgi:hypothetical protein
MSFNGAGTTARAAQIGSVIFVHDLSVYNCIIDIAKNITMETSINPTGIAAIRMASDWPIDFSGTGVSSATQNQRTLKYNSTTHCFEYQALGTVFLSVHDTNGVGINGSAMPGFALDVLGTSTVGISTANGNFTTGVRVDDDQRLSLSAGDGSYFMHTLIGSHRLIYMVGGNEAFTITDTLDTITGPQVAQLPSSTQAGLYIPFVTGAPTGVPDNAALGISIKFDTTNHKLWAYSNTTNSWVGVVLS